MTPEEKSKELIEKFIPLVKNWDCNLDAALHEDDILKIAKNCANIAIDEILQPYDKWSIEKVIYSLFYENVKQEISIYENSNSNSPHS